MSAENVEIVRLTYEAINRRDWDAAYRNQSPDAELTTPPGLGAGTAVVSKVRAQPKGSSAEIEK
jgi:limonene-1,2-epoxide hydrolase